MARATDSLISPYGEEKPLPAPSTWGRVSIRAARSQHWTEQLMRRFPTAGWRTTIMAGGILGGFVLVLNIALLAWAAARPLDVSTGTRVLATGDCTATQNTFTLSHLAINVLSTILLGTSNAAMQCLCAPTRVAVDKAHAQMKWLDIGISSFRNWAHMDAWRKWCWIILVVSTVPLHLLYNSAIFATTSANEYFAIVVSSNFRDGNFTRLPPPGDVPSIPSTDLLTSLSQKAERGQLVPMSNADCISAYNSPLVSQFSNVVVVTRNQSTDPILNYYLHFPTPPSGTLSGTRKLADWICGLNNNPTPDCVAWLNNPQPDQWTLTFDKREVHVDHCLLETTIPQCTIQFSTEIMIAVILCNIVKVLIFFALVCKRTYQPLITLGDALASFMNHPDKCTIDLGTLSAADVRAAHRRCQLSQGANLRDMIAIKPWSGTRGRWFSGASGLRWGLTYALIVFILALGTIFIAIASALQASAGLGNELQNNFGAVTPELLLESTAAISPIGNILIANAPQLILSLVYLSYNGLWTCVLASAEFARYGRHRQSLRVMQPRGYQRSSYFLSLPYAYALPLLVLSGLIHWTLSQSIFLAEVRVFNPDGVLDPTFSVSCLGYSTLALLITVLIGSLMLLAPITIGWRRFDRGAPLVESNSLAISAACHASTYTSPELLLKYGVVKGERACLNAGPVDPLVPGEQYAKHSSIEFNPMQNTTRGPESRPRLAMHVVILLLNLAKIIYLPFLMLFNLSEAMNTVLSPPLKIGMFVFVPISILYVLCRLIVSLVRWRKGWKIRYFSWHVLGDAIFLLIWIVLFASMYTKFYKPDRHGDYYEDMYQGPGQDVPFRATTCSATLMALWIVSMSLETWLWWTQGRPSQTNGGVFHAVSQGPRP